MLQAFIDISVEPTTHERVNVFCMAFLTGQ